MRGRRRWRRRSNFCRSKNFANFAKKEKPAGFELKMPTKQGRGMNNGTPSFVWQQMSPSLGKLAPFLASIREPDKKLVDPCNFTNNNKRRRRSGNMAKN
jgi:hypothetical protein